MKTLEHDIVLKGMPASPGISIGPAFLYHKHAPAVEERTVRPEETEHEVERLQQAVQRSQKELRKILDFAVKKLGENQARIFEAQLLILEDSFLFDTIYNRIRTEYRNAEYVVTAEIGKYHQMMLAAKDEYTRERANDVEDVRNRILRNLQEHKLISRLEGSSIIVSQNLAAADTVILSRNDVLGYAIDGGGVTSHTALLARALQIPAVVGLRDLSTRVRQGDILILDGYSGTIVINPSPETIQSFEHKRALYKEFEQKLAGLRDLPAETPDGRRVELSANMEFPEELEFIRLQGADGIGLYRSEMLLIGKEVFPSEEEQYEQYRLIADGIYPKRVIIRTFDVGGDKMMVQKVRESNPFLGWRGIRVMLDEPEIFLEQLRAILRASAHKNVSMMFPMVTSIKEVRLAKTLLHEAMDRLRWVKQPFDEKIKVGVMIEVPAAAVIMDELAQEVDFVSIGTNDLIQYLLAVDRGNDIVSNLYQEFHPAVIRFIRRIIERTHAHNIPVGMCGEMAGDPLATILLLGFGLDEFSVAPALLPEIKRIIRSTPYTEAQAVAQHVLRLQTEDDIKEYVHSIVREKFPDFPMND
jgi:phosphotransferase system enzyme I (PtsI)